MNAAGKTVIYFYRKHGCHLCDDMARALAAFMQELNELDSRRGYAIIERDIEDDPRWFARYREYIPLLVVNGEEICHYFFDRDELKSVLLRQ